MSTGGGICSDVTSTDYQRKKKVCVFFKHTFSKFISVKSFLFYISITMDNLRQQINKQTKDIILHNLSYARQYLLITCSVPATVL
jgi:hypothetical protein